MRRFTLLAAASVAGAALIGTVAEGDRKSRGGEYRPLGSDASFTTVHKDALGLEGLTADAKGNLYSPARGGDPCPVVRVPANGGTGVTVGTLPAPCNPAGLAFDRKGELFVADSGRILRFRPSASSPPVATVFATDVPGSNGVAFDERGRLWVSDGGTGQGRVWRIGDDGIPHEMFRVQPMVNDAMPGGVGRDPRSAPPATVTITDAGRQASNTLGSQHLVANGLAFDRDGSLFIGDTARGAIWRVELDRRGNVRSPTGCDTTFMSNTLCLDNVFVQHPWLEGVDGIALDREGNVISAVNERNAVVVATQRDGVVELFRNPVSATRLRNEGPLEFPTSPVIVDRRLCLAHSDGTRRDNAPNAGGEVGPAPGKAAAAKLSCLDRKLPVEGLPLPVR
ncbi:MAG TPA: SMP-30/gluconolactonase/LRE family protein [Solirubrobacteraceae bacterium]|nr:SMP-30/gluconolactonase/LRE family protein [Solirubrobacteraceae bacterium]